MTTNESGLCGLILAGGRSQRMGYNKGRILSDGRQQQDRLYELMGRHCQHVWFSCRENKEDYKPYPVIVDTVDFEGPLAGIFSAFESDPGSAWLIVAIDMVGTGDEALNYLVGHRDTQRLATCFLNPQLNRPEPLLSLWEPHAASSLRKYLAGGHRSAWKFLSENDVSFVPCPDLSWLTGINTPSEWEAWNLTRDKGRSPR